MHCWEAALYSAARGPLVPSPPRRIHRLPHRPLLRRTHTHPLRAGAPGATLPPLTLPKSTLPDLMSKYHQNKIHKALTPASALIHKSVSEPNKNLATEELAHHTGSQPESQTPTTDGHGSLMNTGAVQVVKTLLDALCNRNKPLTTHYGAIICHQMLGPLTVHT